MNNKNLTKKQNHIYIHHRLFISTYNISTQINAYSNNLKKQK